MKKFATLAGSAALLLSMAAPAFAYVMPWFPMPQDELKVENVGTHVTTTVYTKAETGDNKVGGMFVMGGKVWTGPATAVADVATAVNTTDVAGCDCFDKVTVKNLFTGVTTGVTTKADSGGNSVYGMKVGGWFGPVVMTGAAGAQSTVAASVNTTLVGD